MTPPNRPPRVPDPWHRGRRGRPVIPDQQPWAPPGRLVLALFAAWLLATLVDALTR